MFEIFKRRHSHEGNNEEEIQVAPSANEEASELEKYSTWIILGMLFLLPILFVPSLNIPFQFTKTVLVFVGIFLALILFFVSRLKEGKLSVPYNSILLALWLLPVAYFVTSIFSSSPRSSFLGSSFEIDTFSYIAVMALFTTLIVLLFRRKEMTLHAYIVLFSSFIVLWLFQGLRLIFGPEFLSFNVLTLPTSNVLGKWNDLAIFFGLATVLTLVTLASLQLSKSFKRVFYLMLLISLFFLAVVNFNIVWIIVGVFSLGFFVHSISAGRFDWKKAAPAEINEEESHEHKTEEPNTSTLSLPALIVLIVSVIFILGGDTVGNAVSSRFNISQIEARPSWQTTIDIGKETYRDNPVFGSGPNTFVKQWTKFKPQAINNTIFWNADFITGIGTIPTSFVTTGILGVLAWVLFLSLYIYGGLRALILSPVDNRFSYYISLSSFLAGLYLWVLAVFYTPNVVLVTLAFFFTAVFIASLRHYSTRFREVTFVFANNPKTGFVSVLGLTILLLVTIVGIYTVGREYVAATKFQNGVVALNVSGNIDQAEARILESVNLSTSDRSNRLLADINVGRIGILQSRTDLSEDQLRAEFQRLLALAIQNGQRATDIDGTNYQNWLALGRVYQSVVPLGIEGAYENAITSFEQALVLSPSNAGIFLTLARLEVARGETQAARDFIREAVQLKSDYTEAIFLLSQIEIAEGNLEEAIRSVEAASIIAPNNPVVFFQLGLLRYNENNNDNAIAAFERAVGLNEVYSNARYFLGLAYGRVGRTEDAILQFERIEELNPDNQEVKIILGNLRAGRAPFENTVPPAEPPEQREELPIEEGIPTDPEEELPTG